MIQKVIITSNTLAKQAQQACQTVVQKTNTDLLLTNVISSDCFTTRPNRFDNVTSITNPEEEKITNETLRLVLTNIIKENNAIGFVEKYKNLKDLFLKQFPNGDSDKLIADIDIFKNRIKDPLIKETLLNKINSFNSAEFLNLSEILPEWKKLVELDSALQNLSYPLDCDNRKVLKILNPIRKEISKTPLGKEPNSNSARLLSKEIKFSALKEYILEYNPFEPKLTNYLYENYYLQSLPQETKAVCEDILKEFNTKLFLEDDSNHLAAKYVQKELREWKMAGKDAFKAPSTLDLSRYESYYYSDNSQAIGFFDPINNSVHAKGDELNIVMNSLRHELEHANDKTYDPCGLVNGIDVDKIIVRGADKKPILGKCLYKDEFFNAGVSIGRINYAYTNLRELKAVASEGDYSRYSPEFKALLIKLGMPKYIFEMKPSNSKYVQNASYIARLKKEHPELKTREDVISYIKNKPFNLEEIIKTPSDLLYYRTYRNYKGD